MQFNLIKLSFCHESVEKKTKFGFICVERSLYASMFDWGPMYPLHTHILLRLNLPYPVLYPVLEMYHRKETWTLNPWTLCVFQSSVFSCFPPLNPLTLIPMVYYSPTSSTFSSCHSFILLIPIVTISLTPVCLVIWLSYSCCPTAIYPLSSLFSPMTLPRVPFPTPCSSLPSVLPVFFSCSVGS